MAPPVPVEDEHRLGRARRRHAGGVSCAVVVVDAVPPDRRAPGPPRAPTAAKPATRSSVAAASRRAERPTRGHGSRRLDGPRRGFTERFHSAANGKKPPCGDLIRCLLRHACRADTLLPPRYEDARPLARGGMGEIYRATDRELGREVAVKVLADRYSADADSRARFRREALAAARLSGDSEHRHDLRCRRAQRPPADRHGALRRRVAGGAARWRRLPARSEQALDWLEQAAAALDAAHAAGIVHRDVKPANLLLDDRGHVHVADFGIASAAGLDSFTQAGTILGTAGYLSPEQAKGERATSASDLYGLAVVAWELLTGHRPFENASATAEAAAHANAPVPSVHAGEPRAAAPPTTRSSTGRSRRIRGLATPRRRSSSASCDGHCTTPQATRGPPGRQLQPPRPRRHRRARGGIDRPSCSPPCSSPPAGASPRCSSSSAAEAEAARPRARSSDGDRARRDRSPDRHDTTAGGAGRLARSKRRRPQQRGLREDAER